MRVVEGGWMGGWMGGWVDGWMEVWVFKSVGVRKEREEGVV